MALTRQSAAVTFSTAASVNLNTNNLVWSDAVTLDATTVNLAIQVSVDNSGTPASGDYVDVYIAWSTGDILGDSNDDFDTDEHATVLGRLDTVIANTPGEDPVRKTFPDLPVSVKAFKIGLKANQGGTRAITGRVMMHEQRAA